MKAESTHEAAMAIQREDDQWTVEINEQQSNDNATAAQILRLLGYKVYPKFDVTSNAVLYLTVSKGEIRGVAEPRTVSTEKI